jgi:hypothetical protein
MPIKQSFLLLLLLMLSAPLAVTAQDAGGPILLADDAIRILTPGNTASIDVPLASSIAQSPDGRYVAITRYPQVLPDVEMRSGATPSDLWLYDSETGEAYEIAGQPDPVYYEGSTRDNAIARSPAVWSLDGSQLVWTEYAFDTNDVLLAFYDVVNAEKRLVPFDFPEQFGVPGPDVPVWIDTGIAFRSYHHTDAGDQIAYRVHAPNGALIAVLAFEPLDVFPSATLLVAYRGRDYLAQHDSTRDIWLITDILDGRVYTASAYPQLISRTAPDTSLRIIVRGLVPYSRHLEGQATMHYQIDVRDASGALVIEALDIITPSQDMSSVLSLSPDAQTLALHRYDEFTRVYGKTLETVGATTAVLLTTENYPTDLSWGAQEWILPDDAELTLVDEPQDAVCDAALPTRLVSGQNARVMPGSPNRLRLSPSVSGEVAGQISEGTTVPLQRGPVCADGIAWWLTEYEGIIGWTAEGADVYFLEPAP